MNLKLLVTIGFLTTFAIANPSNAENPAHGAASAQEDYEEFEDAISDEDYPDAEYSDEEVVEAVEAVAEESVEITTEDTADKDSEE